MNNRKKVEKLPGMSPAEYLIFKTIKYWGVTTCNYDEALQITCTIEKIYFKKNGHIMPNELFDQVFDQIYIA